MEVLLRFLYVTTAVMAVPRRQWRCRGDRAEIGPTRGGTAEVFNMFKVSAVPPRRSAVLKVFRGVRRSAREPLRNHDDHGGATEVYAVQVPQWHRASGVTG